MTWYLVALIAFTPGKWQSMEVKVASQAECLERHRVATQNARERNAYEFVIRCEERKA